MEYGKTLNLPNTSFAMKANLPLREPTQLAVWEKEKLYHKIREKRAGAEKFVLHDGPPYANGDIHVGTVLNKVLKDMVVKYKTMSGYDSPYIPGWDCHGMPIEHKVAEKHKVENTKEGVIKFRKACKDYALKYVDIQRGQFKRLGILGDWEHPYLTLDHGYEATIISTFARLVKEGYIYKGLRPVLWCINHRTALADAEVEYEDDKAAAIFVKFEITEGLKNIFDPKGAKAYFLIWTTTPWTIPANLAVALNPKLEYSVIKTDGIYYILAGKLSESVAGKAGFKYETVKSGIKGSVFEGVKYRHPFMEKDGVAILGEHVTDEDGTGVVHTAPGHGEDDFIVGKKYSLPAFCPVDASGAYTEDVPLFKGKKVFAANPEVISLLKEKGALVHTEEVGHSYPHCWRCHKPVIFRTTEQWFMSVEHKDLRSKMLQMVKNVGWHPASAENRMAGMLSGRPDWCLSRQRYWGVPLPILYCEDCAEPVTDGATLDHITAVFAKEGSDAWFEKEAPDFVLPGYKCKKCGGSSFKKDMNVFDVWFDAGNSHYAVLKKNAALEWPASLYSEGSDQHRGWFQLSLLPSAALEGKPPFKNVLTHGYVVDGEGKKMSKSLGNLVTGEEACKKYGADITRMWVAASDYMNDVRFSEEILARLQDAYRKLRNTARYLLSNLYVFDPGKDSLPYAKLTELDRYMLHRKNEVVKEAGELYGRYEFFKFYQLIYNFCVVDLSSFYLDILKDRLYVHAPASQLRRSGQTAMYEILKDIAGMLAPVLVYTSEEIWQELRKSSELPGSVHLSDFPVYRSELKSPDLVGKYGRIIEVRAEVLKLLEDFRNKKEIGHPYEASIAFVFSEEKDFALFKGLEKELPGLLIVSQVSIEKGAKTSVSVGKASGKKCERCWNWSGTVGADEKHAGLCGRCVEVLKETKQY